MTDEEDQIFGPQPVRWLAYAIVEHTFPCLLCGKPILPMQSVAAPTFIGMDGGLFATHHYSCAWENWIYPQRLDKLD